MTKPQGNICIVLPYPPVYSETFLKMHVERLSPTVRYLEHFPSDGEQAGDTPEYSSRSEVMRQRVEGALRGYVLNPAKKFYMRSFFKRNKVGVVLAEYGPTGIGTLGLCEELRIPLVVHFHGSDAYSNDNIRRHQETYKRMFLYASAIIGVSRHMIEQLVRIGAPSDKVFYNPYGVDVSSFKPGSPGEAPLQVIAVGRFVEKKAPYLTILAFQKVLQQHPTAKLVLVGAGELHDVCRQLVKSLHMEHAVDFKGVLSSEKVASLMRQSRVFVQHSLVPSSGDSEGTPVAIIEAGASGLPVVSTRHAGITDTVIHGKTGFLVEEGDVDGMSAYLSVLLGDAARADQMGASARAHISQNFSSEGSISRLKDILDRYAR